LDFKRHISEGRLCRLYAIAGADAFLADSAAKMLAATAELPDFNVNIYSGAADLGSLENALITEPMMAERRIVLLKGYSGKIKPLIPLLNIEKIPESTVFAVIGTADSEAIKEAGAAGGEFVDCSPLDTATLLKYIKRESPSITADAAVLLIEYTGGLMTRISTEILKLNAYADGGEITVDAVKLMVKRDAEYKIYEFSEMLAKRRTDDALAALKLLREDSDDVRILSGVYSHFRRLMFASLSRDGDEELARQLGVKTGALKFIREQARLFTPRKLKSITDYLGGADYAIKSGTANAPEILNNAALKIMQE